MKGISSVSITAPGFYGLNLQESSIDLPVGYALAATNCIIDTYGRLGSRKGWVKANTTSADLSTANVTAGHELIGLDGNNYVLCTGNGKLYTLDAGSLTVLTYGGGGSAPTLTDENWQIVSLNGKAYFFQRGYDPLIFDPSVSTTTFRRVNEVTGYAGDIPLGNTASAAYGHLWVANTNNDKHTIAFSDLLSGHIWTGGTSGTLDISKTWVSGSDEIVAIEAHNNFLIIFGKKQILIYAGADSPSTMTLSDTVSSIGCAGRDTVQNTGKDLLFVSFSGLRSLERTIQEKSAPLGDLSKNIRDVFTTDTLGCNEDDMKSIYSDIDAFYLVTMPTSNITYCFDTRMPLDNGAFRVTQWSLVPKCLFHTRDKTLYMGFAGYVGRHQGYSDNSVTYNMSWFSTYMTLGNPNVDSIIKKINLAIIGGNGQTITVSYGFDYSTSAYRTASIALANISVSEWGIFEWGIGEYTSNVILNNRNVNLGGAGKIFQLGLTSTINGAKISYQKIDIFFKQGKVLF